MAFTRRDFLQKTTLAAAGVSLGLAAGQRWSDRYGRLLAAPVRRKVAVLVGIDTYMTAPESDRALPSLEGCGADIDLQQDLLVSRFGFERSAIHRLRDRDATADAIESAIVSAATGLGADDTLVVHFSGYGGRSRGPAQGAGESTRSLVPADAVRAGDVPEALLVKLCQSLPTQRVAISLDASDGPSISPPGNGFIRGRSRSPGTVGRIDSDRWDRLQKLHRQTGTKDGGPLDDDSLDGFGGLLLRASAPETTAVELHWASGWAGAFTRSLVQHLWQTTPATTVWIDLAQSHGAVSNWLGGRQFPESVSTKPLRPSKNGSAFHLGDRAALPSPGAADGAVVRVNADGGAAMALAGIPAPTFELAVAESVYRATTAAGQSMLLQGRDRQGWLVYGRPASGSDGETRSLAIGDPVEEWVRVLPKHIELAVALDPSLERIERIDAISALAAQPHIIPVTPGDRLPDVWFASMPAADGDHYGLLALGRGPLAGTAGDRGEAVKPAVQRLIPQLDRHLAQKHLRLLENQGSSQLPVRISLESGDRLGSRSLAALGTRTAPVSRSRADALANAAVSSSGGRNRLGTFRVAAGKPVQYRIENSGDRPIQVALLGFNTRGNSFAFYSPEPIEVAPGATYALAGGGRWSPSTGPGALQTYLVCSAAPCPRLQDRLNATYRERNLGTGVAPLSDPLAIARDLWRDLSDISQSAVGALTFPNDAYAFHTQQWALFELSFELVE